MSLSRSRSRSSRLLRLNRALGSRRQLLILSHNNPDPDAIASAWALKKVLEASDDKSITLGYSGLLGRSENRAIARSLEVPFRRIDDPSSAKQAGRSDDRSDCVVSSEVPPEALILVDCQPGSGNVSLPPDLPILAVVDHHPRQRFDRVVPYTDRGPSFGSCIALVFEYFKEAHLEPDALTATISYYAIRTETQELGREADRHDRALFRRLAHLVDWELHHRIAHAPVPRSYYSTFKVALERARLYDDALFADAGELPIPDAAAEIADWLLRLDEVNWALCWGTYKVRLLFSLRSRLIGARCGERAARIVEGWGTAGGHGSMAGGQVVLSTGAYDRAASLIELEARYLRVMNCEDVLPVRDPFAVIPGGLSQRSRIAIVP